MKITKELALSIWEDIYGDEKYARDCFGVWMHRDDYGEKEVERLRPDGDGLFHNYGWELDHIRPQSSFARSEEADFKNNLEPVHHHNNKLKSNKYPNFEIGEKVYKIIECRICKMNSVEGYGLLDLKTRKRVDWKGKKRSYYSK